MLIYGNCIECGATPCDDQTGLCEMCEEEARQSGELDDDDDSEPYDDDDEYKPWDMKGA